MSDGKKSDGQLKRPSKNRDQKGARSSAALRAETSGKRGQAHRAMPSEPILWNNEELPHMIPASLLGEATIALFIGVEGIIVHCNGYACDMLGYVSPVEVCGTSMYDLVPEKYHPLLKKRLQPRRKGAGHVQTEFEMKGRDGRAVWLEAVFQAIFYQNKAAVLMFGKDISYRIQLEEALRTSEYKYRSLLENAGEAVLVLQDGRIKFFNKRTPEMIGRSERELAAKSFAEFIHPDDRAMVLQRYQQRMQGIPTPASYVFRVLHGSGDLRWTEIKVAEIIWEGRPATLNFLDDITQRRAAEQELDNKMRQLSWISSSASTLLRIETRVEILEYVKGILSELSGADYLVISDYDPEYQSIVPRYHIGLEPFLDQARKTFGLELGQFSVPMAELAHQMDDLLRMEIHLVERGFYTLLNKKYPLALCRGFEKLMGIEKIYIRAFIWKGRLFGGLMLAFKKGHLLQNQTILEPIINQAALALGRRMYEESLLHSEEKYRLLIDSLGEGVSTTDLREVFTFANPAADEIFGMPRGGLVGRSLLDFLSDDDQAQVLAETGRKKEHQREQSKYEIVITRTDGQQRNLLVTSSALLDQNRQLTGTFGIFRDITERKSSEEALQRKAHEDAALASISSSMLKPDATLDRVVEQILVHARSLTGSRHGFVSFIDQENGDNIVQINTTMFGRTPTDRNKTVIHRTSDGRYPGLLGQSLNTRSVCVLNTLPSRSGALAWPKEYVALDNFLSIPVQFGEQLLGQIGMANSERGYGAPHIEVLQRIAELYALFLQQKKMMQVIEESEDRYSTFVNSNLDMVFLKDTDYRYAVVNSQLAEFFGKTAPEVIGRTDYDLMSEAAADACRFSDEEALRKGEVFINEEVIGQRVYETRKFPVTIKNKKVVGGIIRDITAQKAAQEEILKLSKGIEQSPASVVITDIQGNIEYVNAKFCTLTGYTLEEVIGKNPRILKSTEDNVTDYTALWNTILAGEEWRGEFYNRKKSGELCWEWASISPIKNEAGTISHFIAVKEDITDYKRLQKELIAARDKAEESDRLKSAFLKNISHEIRTPLNGIMGFTELLLDPNNSDDERLQFSYHITLSVNRLIKTVTDIINIASIETGQEVVREKTADLMQLLENAFEELQRTADSKIQITLQTDLQPEECSIWVDEAKLSQILANLTENALKFTYSGEINLGCRRLGDELQFFVTDTGIGIPLEHHQTIFERFRQVDDSLNRQYEGTGLGLSICKSYVDMMGGRMWLESEQGRGSSFYFTIPFKPAAPLPVRQQQQAPAVLKPPARAEKTVLIVEDGEINFLLAKEYLSGLEVNILHATNGSEAVDMCLAQPEIDLVLMDIKMPVMDGFEATRLIKDKRPHLPIIAQTAYALFGDRDKAINEGCDDYIAKPFKKDDLLAKISQYL